jgi:fatty-acyl-CoA synthase
MSARAANMTGAQRLYTTAFDAQARRSGAEVAVTDGIDPADVTYAELAHATECVAAGLARLGLGPGDRLAIAMEPSAAYLAVVLGCIRAGVAAAPLNTRLAQPELVGYVQRTQPRLGVFDPAHGELAGTLPAGSVAIEDAHRRLPLVRRLGGIVAEPCGAPRADERSAALILPTGGTTGVPKAAVMLHQGLWASATASSASQLSSDVELWCTPLFHVGIAMLPLGVLLCGARLRLLPRFDVDAVADALGDQAQGITGMSLTYTLYRAIRNHCSFETIPRGLMRRIACGGASITAFNCQEIHADWPAAGLSFGYASTEFGRACAAGFEELRERDFVGVGRPVPGAQISVRDDTGRPLPAGEEGLITVRAPWSCDRYLNDEAQTAATWTPHGVQVGDIGLERDGGWFVIRGRVGDMIKTGGEIVYPADVEAVLNEHPLVAEVIVYGVPDSYWGERVEAAVVPSANARLTAGQIIEFARGRAAGYKLPKQVRFYASLPRTSAGKVDRRFLRNEAIRLSAGSSTSA